MPTPAIWILTHREDDSDKVSTSKIARYLGDAAHVEYVEDCWMSCTQANGLELFIRGQRLDTVPEIVYIRLNSGVLRSDVHITLLRHLNMMGARIVNTIPAMLKATNKFWHCQELALAGVPLPRTFSYVNSVPIPPAELGMEYPMIAKSVHGNRGNQVFMVHDHDTHTQLLGVLRHELPYLYQDYIAESHGRDLRVIVVGGRAVYSMTRTSAGGAMRANISQGGKGEVVTGRYKEAEALAERIADVLEIEICGVDLLFQDGGFVCCEVNNNPGFSSAIHQARDTKIECFIGDYLLSLRKTQE